MLQPPAIQELDTHIAVDLQHNAESFIITCQASGLAIRHDVTVWSKGDVIAGNKAEIIRRGRDVYLQQHSDVNKNDIPYRDILALVSPSEDVLFVETTPNFL